MPKADLFCRVIDNYGDAGIAWRLAVGLARDHGFAVRLFIDDMTPLERLAPDYKTHPQIQVLSLPPSGGGKGGGEGHIIPKLQDCGAHHPLRPASRATSPLQGEDKVADLVVETLGADIPEPYLNAMAARVQAGTPSVWIYYEYLTAEDWVLGAHLKPSPHPRLPLTRHFFYPGFKPGTGGLLWNTNADVCPPPERGRWIGEAKTEGVIGDVYPIATGLSSPVTPSVSLEADTSPFQGEDKTERLKIFMFTYDNVHLASLADIWANGPDLVQLDLSVGSHIKTMPPSNGALIVRQVPFMTQTAFDTEIARHDVLFIRGEDSLTQGVLAGKPVLWHIYPQDEGTHLVKLRAFLAFFAENWDDLAAAEAFTALNLAWNGENNGEIGQIWTNYHHHLPAITARAQEIAADIRKLGSATQNLVDFWAKLR